MPPPTAAGRRRAHETSAPSTPVPSLPRVHPADWRPSPTAVSRPGTHEGLIGRGLGAPMLIVADGAPGLIKAIEQCWPASDRQHCAVHRLRNLLAKLPERERERVRRSYWQALDDATNERDASNDSRRSSTSSTRPATPPRRSVWPTISTRSSCTCATRPDTAAGGDRRTCSSARSARSNAAPRSSAASPARPAASPSSGPCLTSTSATPPTASSSPSSNANTSSGIRYEGHDQTHPRGGDRRIDSPPPGT